MSVKRWLVVIAIALAARCTCSTHHRDPVRIATFNIEDFPKDARQVDGAFTEIAATGASIVAVQEIGDAPLMESTARQRLGAAWRFVAAGSGDHDVGVLYDGSAWTLAGTIVHDETRLGGRHKPAFEVRLARDGRELHVFVLHLKAGGDGHDIRERQLAALAPVLLTTPGDKIVLGDFNATGPADRDDIAALARDTDLLWTSEPLACTAFWSREDGCPRSRLDHVLASRRARIEVGGACATEGCEWQQSCPLYTQQVSDHCPVVATFSD
jgi:endonuclease/exonuclease/phosphatase family metal-dependent hydrolase